MGLCGGWWRSIAGRVGAEGRGLLPAEALTRLMLQAVEDQIPQLRMAKEQLFTEKTSLQAEAKHAQAVLVSSAARWVRSLPSGLTLLGAAADGGQARGGRLHEQLPQGGGGGEGQGRAVCCLFRRAQ